MKQKGSDLVYEVYLPGLTEAAALSVGCFKERELTAEGEAEIRRLRGFPADAVQGSNSMISGKLATTMHRQRCGGCGVLGVDKALQVKLSSNSACILSLRGSQILECFASKGGAAAGG